MDPRLSTLIELQKAKGAEYHLESQLSDLPKQRQSIQNELDALIGEVAKAEEDVQQAELQLRFKEKSLNEANEKATKKDAQLFQIKNNKEYQAATAEIETLKKKMRRLEDDIVSSMEEVETAKATVEEKQKKLAERRGPLEERVAILKTEEDGLAGEIGAATKEAERVAAEVSPQLLSRFMRIFNGKQGVAMATANGGFCGACNVKLTPHTEQLARRGQDFVMCEGCGRYLYWDREVEEAPVF